MPEPLSREDQRVLAGRYRLVRALARGGMAEVWEGRDQRLDRPVAVKVLHPHLAADAGFLDRFRHEAVAAARLSHPHIVATFDAGVDGDTAFIVMELVRGTDLRGLLRERGGTLSCRASVDIAAQVADALHYAHEAGLVHRDVKPGNVLWSEGRAKVADFGIAKTTDAPELTRPGGMVGTAAYLAPEQVAGGLVDRRTDVYALGVVLYEMLCGRRPFEGDGDLATAVQRITAEPVPPRRLRAGIPRPLEAVVLRALARDPDARYPSAAELRSALLAVDLGDDDAESLADLDDTPPGGISPSFRQSERSWLATAALIVAVAVVLGLVGVLFARTDVGRSLLHEVRGGPAPTPAALHIASARPFDPPPGDGHEHDEEAALAIDGDPATAWHTATYQGRPDLGGLKAGVGLILVLDRPASLGRLEITSPTNGWAAAVYVAAAPADTLPGWGEPVATRSPIDGGATFDLRGREGGAVLVWITRLGSVPGGFATAIAEARLLP